MTISRRAFLRMIGLVPTAAIPEWAMPAYAPVAHLPLAGGEALTGVVNHVMITYEGDVYVGGAFTDPAIFTWDGTPGGGHIEYTGPFERVGTGATPEKLDRIMALGCPFDLHVNPS